MTHHLKTLPEYFQAVIEGRSRLKYERMTAVLRPGIK